MLVKILGVGDLLAALIFLLSALVGFIPDKLIWIVGLYLVIKGIAFALILDFTSFFDIAAGIVILLSLAIPLHMVIVAIVCLYLIQKGIFSLLA